MGTIYISVNMKTNISYIGQTIQKFEKRLWQHNNDSEKERTKSYFHCAIRKYGIEAFEWFTINIPDEDLNEAEEMLIQDYKQAGMKVYNLTDGGCSFNKGRKPWHAGKKAPQLSKALKGRIPWNNGKKHSKETRQKISEIHKGRKAHNRKKTVLIHPDGSQEIFEALTHAATKYNLQHSGLVRVVNGEINSYKGFRCVYKDEWDGKQFEPFSGRLHSRNIILTHPNGTEEYFDKIKDAEIKYGLSNGHLCQVLRGTIKQAKGFKARYC